MNPVPVDLHEWPSHNAFVRIGFVGCVLLMSGMVSACDVTGWPSTTHHPSPATAVADMQIGVGWTCDVHSAISADRVSAVRAVAGVATIYLDAGHHVLWALFPASATEWSAIQAAVSVQIPSASLPVVRASIFLPPRGAPNDVERTLRAIPGLGIAGVLVGGSAVVVLEFPPGVPYPAAAVWRARKFLAQVPKG